MGWLSAVKAIIAKDLRVDMRRRVEAGSVAVFAVAAGVLAAYVMSGASGISPGAAAVSASLVMVFLAVFGSLSSFVREADRGTLDGLRVAPVGPEALYLAKLAYTYAVIASATLIYLVVVTLFGGLWEAVAPASLAATLASCLYMAAASSLTSAILVFSEARGVLMPVMVLVLVLPFVQLSAPVLVEVYSGVGELGPSLALALASVGFISVATWLSRFILEAV
jgi:ABC-type transport system involved in cytochrome c biogenesis permease component